MHIVFANYRFQLLFADNHSFLRVVWKLPECRNVILPSSSVKTIVTASYNLGFVMVALTVLMDPTNLLIGVTTPRAGQINFIAGTTLAYLGSFIVPVLPTARMVVTKKTAVSHGTLSLVSLHNMPNNYKFIVLKFTTYIIHVIF